MEQELIKVAESLINNNEINTSNIDSIYPDWKSSELGELIINYINDNQKYTFQPMHRLIALKEIDLYIKNLV